MHHIGAFKEAGATLGSRWVKRTSGVLEGELQTTFAQLNLIQLEEPFDMHLG